MIDDDLDGLLNDTPSANQSAASHKRKSLGRGLESLLGEDGGTDFVAAPKSTETIAVERIVAGKYQPRTEFDDEALQALSDSIKEKGLLQPLLVRRQDEKFEIIAGERRWRAAKMAGLKEVPVIVKDLTDAEVLEAALVENVMRENLSAIEEAEGYQRLIDEFSYTQDALAQIVGKSRSHIANLLRLLTLPEEVREMVKSGKLSAGHARCLVGLANAGELATQIVAKDLNVREAEELAAGQKQKSAVNKPGKDKSGAAKNTDLQDIERELVKNLGLRIKIAPNKQGGGKVVLQYSSVAELDMIVEVLQQKRRAVAPTQNTVFKAPEPVAPEDKFSIKIID